MRDQAFRAATNTVCLAEVSNGDDAEGSLNPFAGERLDIVRSAMPILVVSDPNAPGIIEFSQADEGLKRDNRESLSFFRRMKF